MADLAKNGRVWIPGPEQGGTGWLAQLQMMLDAEQAKEQQKYLNLRRVVLIVFSVLTGILVAGFILLSTISLPQATPEGLLIDANSSLDPAAIMLLLIGLPALLMALLGAGWLGVALSLKRGDWMLPLALILGAAGVVTIFALIEPFNAAMDETNGWIRSELSIDSDTRFHEAGSLLNNPNASTWVDGETRVLVTQDDEEIPVTVHRTDNMITGLERIDVEQ